MSKFTRFSPMGDGDIEYFEDGDWCSWDEVEDYVSWTLASERMPRADTVLKVLVYGAGSGYGVEMATWYPYAPECFSPFGVENLPMHMITHWMLLPDPPGSD